MMDDEQPKQPTHADLLAVADLFRVRDPELDFKKVARVHARAGAMVATDGCALIRIESPAVEPIPDSVSGLLDFRWQGKEGDECDETPPLAGREWIEGALRADAERKYADIVRDVEVERRRFLADAFATCPHCGAKIYIDEDREVWRDLNQANRDAPSADHIGVCAEFVVRGGVPPDFAVKLRYLHAALAASARLGGFESLPFVQGGGQPDRAVLSAPWGFVCVACAILEKGDERISFEIPDRAENGAAQQKEAQ